MYGMNGVIKVVGLGLVLGLSAGCSLSGSARFQVAEPGSCGIDSAQPMTWSQPQQQAFKDAAARGPVVLARRGCELDVLPACEVANPAQPYQRVDVAPEFQAELRRHAGLAAVGSAGMSGQLQSTELAQTEYMAAERRHTLLPPQTVLVGQCQAATHVVTAYSLGASFVARSNNTSSNLGSQVASGSALAEARLGIEHGQLANCRANPSNPEFCGAVVLVDVADLRDVCAGHLCRGPVVSGMTAHTQGAAHAPTAPAPAPGLGGVPPLVPPVFGAPSPYRAQTWTRPAATD